MASLINTKSFEFVVGKISIKNGKISRVRPERLLEIIIVDYRIKLEILSNFVRNRKYEGTSYEYTCDRECV